MGFNYLQTDDRDDYLSQFIKNSNKKREIGVTLIDPNGIIIFDNVPRFKVRNYCKKNYLPIGKGAKRIWRKILLAHGYEVIVNYDLIGD